ncbi:MAG: hypothetical protein CL600_05050 [Alteromonas sp.]|nr:hypothetical protein [Alteromonas sp.]
MRSFVDVLTLVTGENQIAVFIRDKENGSCIKVQQRCCSHHASDTPGNLRTRAGHRSDVFNPTTAKSVSVSHLGILATTSVACTNGTESRPFTDAEHKINPASIMLICLTKILQGESE